MTKKNKKNTLREKIVKKLKAAEKRRDFWDAGPEFYDEWLAHRPY